MTQSRPLRVSGKWKLEICCQVDGNNRVLKSHQTDDSFLLLDWVDSSGQLINFTDSGSEFRNSSSLSLGVTRVTVSPTFAQAARSRSTSSKNVPNFLRGVFTVTLVPLGSWFQGVASWSLTPSCPSMLTALTQGTWAKKPSKNSQTSDLSIL